MYLIHLIFGGQVLLLALNFQGVTTFELFMEIVLGKTCVSIGPMKLSSARILGVRSATSNSSRNLLPESVFIKQSITKEKGGQVSGSNDQSEGWISVFHDLRGFGGGDPYHRDWYYKSRNTIIFKILQLSRSSLEDNLGGLTAAMIDFGLLDRFVDCYHGLTNGTSLLPIPCWKSLRQKTNAIFYFFKSP